jgi:lysophospholipase
VHVAALAHLMVAPEIRGPMTPDRVPLRAAIWRPDGTPRAICLLLQGMTEFIEKYQEVADELVARGFVVVSVDWRSQGASERMAPGNTKVHVKDFGEYDVDLQTVLRDVVAPLEAELGPLPLIALAHSMGAHILLRYLRAHRPRLACAVLTTPMLAVDTQPYPPWLTHTVTTLMNLVRPSKRMVFGWNADPMTLPFEKQRATRDRARWKRMQALLRAQPFLRTFGPTFGWLRAAFRSMHNMNSRDFPEEIVTPVLIVAAGSDRIVLTPPQADYAKRLKNGRYAEIADSEHEILMERDSIRAQFWRAFDGFVEERLARA